MFWQVTLNLLEGFGVTCLIFAATLVCALPLGLILAFGSMSKFKPLKAVVKVFVWIIRGTPLMLQILVIYYGPALLFGWGFLDRVVAVIVAFVINYAAYFAEIYRSGIQSIPVGQYEASSVLGYSRAQTFCKIIFPQMVKRVVPAVTNEVITLVKDTSLSFALAYAEMFTIAKQIAASQTSFIPFVVAAVFYYIFNLLVALVMEGIEKKLSYYQ